MSSLLLQEWLALYLTVHTEWFYILVFLRRTCVSVGECGVPVQIGERSVNGGPVLGELLLHVAVHGAVLLQPQHHLLQVA